MRNSKKKIENVRERLSVRKRKAEVIDRCRDTLLGIMLIKGVESWTGKESKTKKLQFIHQSFDWMRLRRPTKAKERDTGRRINVLYIHRVGVFIVCAATYNLREVFSKSRSTYPSCLLYSRKLTNLDKFIRD